MNTSSYLKNTLAVFALLAFSGITYALPAPCIELSKEVSPDGGMTWFTADTENEAVSIVNDAMYKFTVSKCGHDRLSEILVIDNLLGISQELTELPVSEWDYLTATYITGEDTTRSFTTTVAGICSNYEGTLLNTAQVTAKGYYSGIYVNDSDDAWIRCESQTTGGEGCTPGYWKQPHHFDSWPAVVTPATPYSSVFDRIITVRVKGEGMVTDPTLSQALSALGGKVNTAARHSTAAYLNAMTTDVSYDLTADQIINNLQQSIDENDFGTLIEALVNFNEQGCPLN